MEQLVAERVDTFWKGIEGGANKRGQIIVTFSEKRPKKSWFQVYMGEEDVPWEQWVVNAEMRQPKSERGVSLLYPPNLRADAAASADRQAFNTALASTLSKSLHTMLTHTASERGRTAVPLITNATGISPFPVKMTVKVGGVELGGG